MGTQQEAEIVACIPSLRRYARGLAHDPERADDLVQDTLERAWQRFSMWQRRGAVRAWMFGIMHNLHIDRLRSQRRTPEDPAGDDFADTTASAASAAPVTEADLHGYVDRQLPAERRAAVERHLASRPDERGRVEAWQRDRAMLHALLDPVLDEVLPPGLLARRSVARRPAWRMLAAGVAIAAVSALLAWTARGELDRRALADASGAAKPTALSGFALRAAVAHAVYTPEVRRPVEVAADQEQQLVNWLSKRIGAPIRAPALKQAGYELIGGRLLPGDSGPVAQFMYHDASGQRLTLYVTREPPKTGGTVETAFRFGQEGKVNVFYWVDKDFGYALSSATDRQELTRVAHEVYRQLGGS